MEEEIENEGSLIGVFTNYDQAEEWLNKYIHFLQDADKYILDASISPVNQRWRAGIVYKSSQMEFTF